MRIPIIILWFCLFANCYSQQSFDSTGRVFTKLYGVALEKTTIEEAKLLLGRTKEYQDGDAALSSHRINYFIKKDNLYITFDSGEMDGGEKIGSFTISLIPLKEKWAINGDVSLSKMDLFGIHLGMSKYDFLKLFSVQYIMDSTKQEYRKTEFLDCKKPDCYIQFRNKVECLQNSFLEECIMIIPTFKNDRLVTLNVGKTTSD